jgi:hypothetical protein
MNQQQTIPPDAYALLARYGFEAVEDRRGEIVFTNHERAKEGIEKGWFTPVNAPSRPF